MRSQGKVFLCLPGQMDPEKLVDVAGWLHQTLGNPKHLGWRLGAGNIEDQRAATAAIWPTPAAADLAGGRSNPEGTTATGMRPDGKKAQVGLPGAMKTTWRTPTVGDVDATMHADTQQQVMLARQMADATEPSGPTPTGSSATTEKRGAPNPSHPCWLMGYPMHWLIAADRTPKPSRSRS